jgi:hypothetical protein
MHTRSPIDQTNMAIPSSIICDGCPTRLPTSSTCIRRGIIVGSCWRTCICSAVHGFFRNAFYLVEFIALDFLSPVPDLIKRIENMCKDVTHTFFTSYIHVDDFEIQKEMNVPLFQNFLDSIDAVAFDLQNACLQTGGKLAFVPSRSMHIVLT